jgi:SpoVK/Ycf46/Vps4 family AAA+-type ATPase
MSLLHPGVYVEEVCAPSEPIRGGSREELAGARAVPGAVRALSRGPAGSGKRRAARALAAELGRPLVRVDLARVTSKSIAETEKNRAWVFELAAARGAVRLLDEADALFGERTEVRDADERFADALMNFLLQRIETFEGVVVLATNQDENIDPAFVRRLHRVVDFGTEREDG